MAIRITGLATGLDIDAVIKETMQAYRVKIDTQQQKKDVIEIKQQLYRDLIKEAQELYNKHFDILKSGSLLKSSSWQSVKFTSNSDSLVVTGSSTAKAGTYKVQSGKIAKAASIIKTEEELGSKVIINGQKFELIGSTAKEKADNLNKALTNAGISVSVRYTDFASDEVGSNKKAFIFESTLLGADNNFVLGGTKTDMETAIGVDAKGAEISGIRVEMLINNIDTTKDPDLDDNVEMGEVFFKIGEEEFIINLSTSSEIEDIKEALNNILSNKGYSAEIDDEGNITFITTKLGSGQTPPDKIEIKKGSSDDFEIINITEENFKDGTDAVSPTMIVDIDSLDNSFIINNIVIDFSVLGDDPDSLMKEEYIVLGDDPDSLMKEEYINKILKARNVPITAKIEGDNLLLTSSVKGSNAKIEFSTIEDGEISKGGQDAYIVITNDKGGVYTHTGNTNNFTLDGVNFNFISDIPEEGIKVVGKEDATEIVESIKSFITDYNNLIVKINTLLTEKRDRNYQPLTKDQKNELSEKEIELWENKVKQGQLRGDSDLSRIANALKQGMRNLVSGVGLTLKDIGIESVQDFGGTKDGTFKINEEALKKAIEENTEAVAKLFMQSPPSNVSESDAYNQKGIMVRLKDILYNETVSSKAILAQKVGFEGTITIANNTLTKQIESYQRKIEEMEYIFAEKEQALYKKYASLETIMNSYNSQITYLQQSLGMI